MNGSQSAVVKTSPEHLAETVFCQQYLIYVEKNNKSIIKSSMNSIIVLSMVTLLRTRHGINMSREPMSRV